MSGNSDAPQVDTSEQIYISSLALLKMLKHGASWEFVAFAALTHVHMYNLRIYFCSLSKTDVLYEVGQ